MINTRTELVIDVGDWDALVVETYKRPYNFQQQDGCKDRQRTQLTVPSDAWGYDRDTVLEVVNGSEMGVTFKAWLERDPAQYLPDEKGTWSLEMWWHRNFYPDIQEIANDLHAKGLLDAGEYVIDIDW